MNCFQFNNFNTQHRDWNVKNRFNYVFASTLDYGKKIECIDSPLNLSKDSTFLKEKNITENVDTTYFSESENGMDVSIDQAYTDEETDHPLDLTKTSASCNEPSIVKNHSTTTQTVDNDEVKPKPVYKRRIIQCQFCPFTTDHKNNLRKHVIAIHKKPENVECPKCGKTSKHRYSLAVHLNYCGKEPRFHCSVCPKKYLKRDHLQRHVLRKHVEQAQVPTEASNNNSSIISSENQNTCKAPSEKNFNDKPKFSVVNIVEQSNFSAINMDAQPKFSGKECPACGREFQYWGHMQRHYKSCSGSWIQCKYCPYKAKDNAMLQIHVSSTHVNDTAEQASVPKDIVKTEPV